MKKLALVAAVNFIGLFLFFSGIRVLAEEGVCIKVGYIDYSGFIEQNSKGDYVGYGVEYLKKISEYTGYQYEYVYGSLEQCMERLENGEIDLFCAAQQTEERKKKFCFSKYPLGYETAGLYVLPDCEDVYYEDFLAFNGMKIGMIRGSYEQEAFPYYAAGNDFYYKTFLFNTDKEMIEALNSGEITAIVEGGLSSHKNLRVVSKWSVEPFYFMSSKGKEDMLEEIDRALLSVKASNPLYEYELYKTYYEYSTIETSPTFTREEADYVTRHPDVIIGCRSDCYPYTYTDYKTGKSKGIIVELLKRIEEISALKIEFVSLKEKDSAYQQLLEGKLDGLAGINSKDVANTYAGSILLSDPFMKSEMPYLDGSKSYFIMEYQIEEDQIAEEGRIYMNLALSRKADERLLSVINKSIAMITREDMVSAIQAVEADREINWSLIIQRYWLVFTIVLIIILILSLRIWTVLRRKFVQASRYDILTECYNFNYFNLEAPKLIQKDPADTFYIIRFNISKFSYLNQYYGSEMGAELLKRITHELIMRLQKDDMLARISDDSFVFLIHKDYASAVMEKYHSELERIVLELGIDLPIAIKSGIFQVSDPKESIGGMIEKAELALRSIEENPKEFVAYYTDEEEERMLLESSIEAEMFSALENHEFQVYLQPKLDLKTLKVMGAEALIRWVKPNGTVIFPDKFIPVFEKNGFVEKIDLYVLEEVCKYLSEKQEKGETLVKIAINQSRYLLINPEYLSILYRIIEKYKLDTSWIELEVTETMYLKCKDLLLEVIDKIHGLNITIAVDDFGSGYSSLNLLSEIPADILKIDRTFLLDSEDSEIKKAVVKNVVQLAKDLNMKIVCEGVETEEQEEFLRWLGCDMGQGFLYSKPIPISEFEKFLKERNEEE